MKRESKLRKAQRERLRKRILARIDRKESSGLGSILITLGGVVGVVLLNALK